MELRGHGTEIVLSWSQIKIEQRFNLLSESLREKRRNSTCRMVTEQDQLGPAPRQAG